MTGMHWFQAGASLLLGETLATQLFAFQHGYSPLLGEPLLYGALQLYTPLQGLRWAWWWGKQAPERFLGAGLLTVATTAGVLYLAWRPTTQAPPKTEASWATRPQMRRAKLLRRQGVVIGRVGKRAVRHHQPSHTLGVASTQSGKTTSLVAGTILDDATHSLIVHDPKDEGAELPGGEIYQMTAGYRATMSKVIRFQPLRAGSHRYDPLAPAKAALGTPYEIRTLQTVADMLTDPDGRGTDERSESGAYFGGGASDIHGGVLMHGLYTRQATTLGDFYRLWCGELALADLITAMQHTRHVDGHCHPAVVNAIRLLEETADRELSALINTARRALRLWADPLVCQATSGSDFTLPDLREGLRPLTLYCSFPFADQERLRPLSRLMIRQCLEYSASRKTGWHFPLMAVLDEFQSLGRLPILRRLLNYGLGMGVSLVLITPSLNEVDDVWGGRHPFLEGCATKVLFGVRDSWVAERFGSSFGTHQVTRTRESWADGQHRFDRRRTVSTEEREEPLISTTEMLELDDNEVLAKAGKLTLRLTKAYYKHNRRWYRRSQIPAPA